MRSSNKTDDGRNNKMDELVATGKSFACLEEGYITGILVIIAV